MTLDQRLHYTAACSRCYNAHRAFLTMRHNIYPIAFRQSSVLAVDTAVYAKPRCRTKFGERGFSHAGPTAWNSLPHHLNQISDTGLFKRRLKTELFRRAYGASPC